MNNESLTHFSWSPAFRHMAPAELMDKAQSHEIAASQELEQFTRLKHTFQVGKERRSVMKQDAHPVLAEKARKSGGLEQYSSRRRVPAPRTRGSRSEYEAREQNVNIETGEQVKLCGRLAERQNHP